MTTHIVNSPGVQAPTSGDQPIIVSGTSFSLNGNNVSYRFHVDSDSGDLIADHFGGRVAENPPALVGRNGGGWSTQAHIRREFPDLGRGDFGLPAVQIHQAAGHAMCHFTYQSHTVLDGKPRIPGLPSTFAENGEAQTLVVHLYDSHSLVAADLSYSVFPKHDAIVRSVKITNEGQEKVVVNKLASLSVDLPSVEYDLIGLHGEWTRERSMNRRRIVPGVQGYGSTTGYSSHYHNPFLTIVSPDATETAGDAWGMALVYSGSFSAEVEKGPQGVTRAMIGLNPTQLSWPLRSGESLSSPECIAIYSGRGIGEMSRKYHRLLRQHIIRSHFVNKPRPVLLNSWEGLYFNFNEDTIYKLAQESAKLGVKLFVLDDGWFGNKHPRINDHAGLGDWVVNTDRFPDGLGPLVERVRKLSIADAPQETLQFGLWVEPEMVNVKSELYEQHPDWVLFAGALPRSTARQQLVLNLALPDVQDYIIDSISGILRSAPITYIKWDCNRGIHEGPAPEVFHSYMLGVYRVFDELTTRFPDVLWEGCASGGGRFDAGMLQYFPQIWTSDNMDPLDRLHIQFGTSLAFPASTMGAHIGSVPSDTSGRTTPMTFRAHVALMGGSFGLELDPDKMPAEDKALIPELIALAERINPIVIRGDLWRLNLPGDSNYPAAMYVSEDGAQVVLFAFQVRRINVYNQPILRLHGLDAAARYTLDGHGTYAGDTLMNGGIQLRFGNDYDSRVILIEKISDNI